MQHNTRPASFDAGVLQWMPLLRMIAKRLEPNPADREDLVQDTVTHALAHWESYNPDKKIQGWLAWRMRGVLANRRNKSRIKAIAIGDREFSTAPTQDGAAEANIALSQLRNKRDEIMLVRYAAGTSLQEMATEQGVSREMASKLTRRARRNFAKRIGYRMAA